LTFKLTPKVQVTRDAEGAPRALLHFQEPYGTEHAGIALSSSPTTLAASYLHDVASIYGLDASLLANLSEKVGAELTSEGNQVRLVEEKTVLETTTVGFVQTHFGLPVWQHGFSVHMHSRPLRVTSSQSSIDPALKVRKPKQGAKFTADGEATMSLLEELAKASERKVLRVNGRRPLIYKYDEADRLPQQFKGKRQRLGVNPTGWAFPTLSLPPVPATIHPDECFVVTEALFTTDDRPRKEVHWRAFIEVESGSVLYLRPFVAEATGNVYLADPLTRTGDATTTPCSPESVLDLLGDVVTLQGLNTPAPGNPWKLTDAANEFVQLSDKWSPSVAAPTSASGNFLFSPVAARDNFAAVGSYYHVDSLFRLLQSMGFAIKGSGGYFDGTAFPVPVDHRDGSAGTVNAHCDPDATGTGIGAIGFNLASDACTGAVTITADRRIVIHEFCHGCLEDNIHSPNFGFAHNGGDGMAVILLDPGSQAPDRFVSFPWIPKIIDELGNIRRHDRDVTAGWAWGGANDFGDGSYTSEQIFSTTLFRLYRSTDGDSPDLAKQTLASNYVAFLYFQAITTFDTDPVTPTSTPDVFATAMMDVDANTAMVPNTGIPGGAVQKVIRWSFEKQGLYQPAGAPTPVVTPGAPPDVDVYIDDGRGGEYQYLDDFWETADIWNRLSADGGLTHETPIVSVPNYMYVRVKNRGTQAADNVLVRGYHCVPSSGLTWPDDWQAMTTSEVTASSIPSGGEVVVGPFQWTPVEIGHECMLASVSADGDLSNIDPTSTLPCNVGPTPHWRLVPFDNNISQRNVAPVAGGGHITGLVGSFVNRHFWARNPFDTSVKVNLEVELPPFLGRKGWSLRFLNAGGASFTLGARGSREVTLELVPGGDFSPSEVEAAGGGAKIVIRHRANGMVIGGMTYLIDPKLTEPPSERPGAAHPGPEGGEGIEGKVSKLLYDCYGDFEGFVLDSCPGEHTFKSRERAVEELIRRACCERSRITVYVHGHDRSKPRRIVLSCA
jgi:zinc metalloprotease ZmpB